MGSELPAVGSIAVCKFCGKEIRNCMLVFAPSVWVHTETKNSSCWPFDPVATPEDD